MTDTDFSKATPRPWRYENDGNGHDEILGPHGQLVVDSVGRIDGPLICAAVNTFDPEREKKVEALVSAAENFLTDIYELFESPDHLQMALELARSKRPAIAPDQDGPETVVSLRQALHSLKGGENG